MSPKFQGDLSDSGCAAARVKSQKERGEITSLWLGDEGMLSFLTLIFRKEENNEL